MFEKVYGEAPSQKSSFFSWMFYFIRPFKWKFFLLSFTRILLEGIGLFVPLLIKEMIDFMQNSDLENFNKIYFYVGMIFCVKIFSSLIFYFQKEEPIFRNLIKRKMGVFVFNKTLGRKISWYQKEDSGSRIGRITGGRDAFSSLLRLYQRSFLKIFSKSVFVLTIILLTTPRIFLILFAGYIFVYIIFSTLTAKWMKKYLDVVNSYFEKVTGRSFEYASSIFTIKTFNLINYVVGKIWKSEEVQQKNMRRMLNVIFSRFFILNIFNTVFFVIIILKAIAMLKLGVIGVGVVVMIIWYLRDLSGVLMDFADVYDTYFEQKEKFLRIKRHFDDSSDKKSGSGSLKDWDEINFENVSFAYKRKNVLKDFNLKIKKGEKVAFVGQSGSGKSTLLNLILNYFDVNSGKISIGKKSISEFDKKKYLENFSVVLQELELFDASIKENILLDIKKNRSDILKNSLKLSCLDSFVSEKGIDAFVGEKGLKVSGGEKQRISIARALARMFDKGGDIVLLDEPTSALDNRTEKEILNNFRRVFKNKTVLFVSHNLKAIKDFDRIIVLDKGRIVEEGNYKSLIARRGAFWELWKKEK